MFHSRVEYRYVGDTNIIEVANSIARSVRSLAYCTSEAYPCVAFPSITPSKRGKRLSSAAQKYAKRGHPSSFGREVPPQGFHTCSMPFKQVPEPPPQRAQNTALPGSILWRPHHLKALRLVCSFRSQSSRLPSAPLSTNDPPKTKVEGKCVIRSQGGKG